MRKVASLLYEKGPAESGLNYFGEYRGGTDEPIQIFRHSMANCLKYKKPQILSVT